MYVYVNKELEQVCERKTSFRALSILNWIRLRNTSLHTSSFIISGAKCNVQTQRYHDIATVLIESRLLVYYTEINSEVIQAIRPLYNHTYLCQSATTRDELYIS